MQTHAWKGARSVGRRGGFGLVFAAVLAAPLMWGSTATATSRPASSSVGCPAARVKGVAGIAWAGRRGQRLACTTGTGGGGGTPPSSAYNGVPPLVFHGGALVGVSTPGELTVTPIYWVPAGFSIPSGYKSTIT